MANKADSVNWVAIAREKAWIAYTVKYKVDPNDAAARLHFSYGYLDGVEDSTNIWADRLHKLIDRKG